jgi:hypothetical protein
MDPDGLAVRDLDQSDNRRVGLSADLPELRGAVASVADVSVAHACWRNAPFHAKRRFSSKGPD